MPVLFFKTWEGELTIMYQNIHIELVNFEVSLFIFLIANDIPYGIIFIKMWCIILCFLVVFLYTILWRCHLGYKAFVWFFFFIYLIFFIGYRWPDSIGRCPVQNRRNLIFWNGQFLHREVNLFLLACVNSDAWHFISILGVLLAHLIII